MSLGLKMESLSWRGMCLPGSTLWSSTPAFLLFEIGEALQKVIQKWYALLLSLSILKPFYQWPFQEPQLEVPTIYKA